MVLCLALVAWAGATEAEAAVEDVPQISIAGTDSLESELDALRAGLNNAPPGAKSALEALQEKLAASDAIKFVPGASADPVLLESPKGGSQKKSPAPRRSSGNRNRRPSPSRRTRKPSSRKPSTKASKDNGLDAIKKKMSKNVNNIDNHLRRIVKDVDSIVRTKAQFTQAVKSGAASEIKSYQAAKKKIASTKPKARRFPARNAKDVIDCTACRYAWLRVEQDLGNTYSEKALYDSFVTTCASMQMTNIFFTACNDMFSQVDDMIGDYLNGRTVNQLCMHARMCR